MRNSIPTAEDFQSGRVTNPGQSEVIRQTLYDWQLYPLAGVTQMSFFAAPAGQGVATALGSVVGSAKSLQDTNMVLGNQLPSGMAFMIESIEVFFLPGSSAAANTYLTATLKTFAAAAAATVQNSINDVNVIYQSGLLELNVLQKNYLREAPLFRFPPKTGFDLSGAEATNSATVGEVAMGLAKAAGRAYYLEPEVTLQPAVNWEVVIRWPAAVVTPSGFNGRLGVVLDGYMMRAGQ